MSVFTDSTNMATSRDVLRSRAGRHNLVRMPVEPHIPHSLTNLARSLAALSIALAACSSGEKGTDVSTEIVVPGVEGAQAICEAGQTDGDLNLYNWSRYIDPELIVAFEAEFGVDVVEDFYDSNEVLHAKLRSGAVYDLIVPSDYMVTIMIDDGIIAEIQRDAIPNLRNLIPFFADPSFDPGGIHSVAYQWGTTGFAVNLDIVGEDFEPTWGLVFDPDVIATYPGGISLLNDPRETMGAALKYLGYSLNSTNETELREAADVIAAAKRYVAQFESDSYAATLVSGRVVVAHGYSGNFFASFSNVDEPAAYRYVIPAEGATLWIDNMSIPVLAEHPCTAHTFIDFILDAENGAALTNWSYYASPNEAAEAFINPEILTDDVIYPSDELLPLLEVMVELGEFEVRYAEYFVDATS